MEEDTTTHLISLMARRCEELYRLGHARNDQERQLRQVWIDQLDREIDAEKNFLGFGPCGSGLSDDEILRELGE